MSDTEEPQQTNIYLEKAKTFFTGLEQNLDLKNVFNPFFDPYSFSKEVNGQKMDYFGYQAEQLTGTLFISKSNL